MASTVLKYEMTKSGDNNKLKSQTALMIQTACLILGVQTAHNQFASTVPLELFNRGRKRSGTTMLKPSLVLPFSSHSFGSSLLRITTLDLSHNNS
ncbi:hypothetical protein CAEBREN_08065 [Caenorhabditis brenneri]|uniref:Uncharacterized protein n=1 Tax=Caenorhabditis brenneri TaxID=135651 RepID=G0MHS8_CAEBE|nr:hypothetical protein CAEBREN_08065 [Caenorhabditis brenneri]